jgi:two-component system LytT family sensor kinase
MENDIKRPFTFNQIEFWTATIVYMGSVCILAYNQFVHLDIDRMYSPYAHFFRERNLEFSYSAFYTIPQFCINTTYYLAFLALTYLVKRSMANWKFIAPALAIAFVIYVLTASSISAANTWMKNYLFHDYSKGEVYSQIFDRYFLSTLWIMLIFCCYTVTKYVLKYVLSSFYTTYTKANANQVKVECTVAFFLWLLWFCIFSHKTNEQFTIIFSEMVLLSIGYYWYSCIILIPQILADKKDFTAYIVRTVLILLASIVPVTLLGSAALKASGAMAANIFTIGITLFFTMPFTWVVYQYRLDKQRELLGLKTALGRSTADLDFLRSQINPHFLFNALNTLYGTALQEKADRTGEGIQKLGDMMRFMLQENNENKILLTREVEYLENYIALQKLRTQTSPDITIQTEISEQTGGLKIAPMMLIPFIENAFKHGISLREASHIKISLETTGRLLNFDVTNSIHAKPDNDPEKDRSGIGLDNVKQRLQLLYPDSHELIVHQSAREFFIHLRVTL